MAEAKKVTPRKVFWLAAAFAALVLFALLPLPESLLQLENAPLTVAGRSTIGVLLFCLILWMSEPMPFHITGLFGMVLLAVLRTETFANIVALGFGSDTIVFFIGVLIISSCIGLSGLGSRISTWLLSATGNSTKSILLGFLLAGAFFGMWMTTLAAAAVLTPLALSVAKRESLVPGQSRFGKALFLAVAWGSLIGGPATPAGSGANPLLIGFVMDMLGLEITFTQWMLFGIPVALVMIPLAWLVLILFFPPEMSSISSSKEELRQEFRAMPPLSRNESSAMLIFAFTIVLWLVSKPLGDAAGMRIPTSLPALLGACLFFFPGVTDIKWKDVQGDISWSGILLIASGVSLGMLMYSTGAAGWIATLLLGGVGNLSPYLQILSVILMVSVLKLGLSSNTVTATVTAPILIALAQQQGIQPMAIIIPAAMTMNTAFILVTSTPTSVLPYATGYFSIPDMAKSGTIMTLAAAPLMTLIIYLIGSAGGIY